MLKHFDFFDTFEKVLSFLPTHKMKNEMCYRKIKTLCTDKVSLYIYLFLMIHTGKIFPVVISSHIFNLWVITMTNRRRNSTALTFGMFKINE